MINNILYIDSNEKFGTNFINSFVNNNFEITWAKEYKDIQFKYEYYNPKIIICDINVESKCILNFLESLKKTNLALNIIIVTNDFEQENLLKCMELGISNYIKKNKFASRKVLELLSKKKINRNFIDKYILGDGYTYWIEKKELHDKNGAVVALNNQERTLLEVLLRNKNNFVPYLYIQNSISKNKEVTIDSLRTTVRHIRKKTYNDIIENLSGYGYKLSLFSESLSYYNDLNEESKIKDKRILIIDDSISLTDSLKVELKLLNLDCHTALTFNEAKSKIEECDYDYILLDLHLPDMSGIELLNNIQAISQAKVIVLTVNSDVHLKEYLYQQGILDYVEKNGNVNYLAYTIYKTIISIEHNDSLNNILIIDPSNIVCEHISNLLKPREYNLTFRHEFNSGMNLLKEQKYNLLIIDLDLLGESSFECLNRIKNMHKELPIIILSSIKKSTTYRDAFKNGASEVLSKPIIAEEFILKVDLWVDYYRKIFQLKNHQQLLNEYKSIVDKASIVSKTDSNGIITYVNKTFCEISGYSEKELLGRSHNLIRHEDMKQETFDELWETIKLNKQIWHGKIKNKRKDGTAYYVESYVMPILDFNAEIIEYIALRNFIDEE